MRATGIVTYVEQVAVGGVKVTMSILYGFIPMLTLFAQTFLVLLALAFVLIAVRILIIDLAPSFANHATGWTHTINAFLATLVVIIDAIKVAINAIKATAGLFTGAQPKAMPDLLLPPQIDAAQVISFANVLITECVPMNNVGSMLSHLVKQGLHSTVCPVLRAATPVRGANAVLDPLLSWASYDYVPWDGNCVHHESMTPKLYCIGLGSGIIIAELLIPLLLTCLLLFNSGAALSLLVGALIYVVLWVAWLVVKAASMVPRVFGITKEAHGDPPTKAIDANADVQLMF